MKKRHTRTDAEIAYYRGIYNALQMVIWLMVFEKTSGRIRQKTEAAESKAFALYLDDNEHPSAIKEIFAYARGLKL